MIPARAVCDDFRREVYKMSDVKVVIDKIQKPNSMYLHVDKEKEYSSYNIAHLYCSSQERDGHSR